MSGREETRHLLISRRAVFSLQCLDIISADSHSQNESQSPASLPPHVPSWPLDVGHYPAHTRMTKNALVFDRSNDRWKNTSATCCCSNKEETIFPAPLQIVGVTSLAQKLSARQRTALLPQTCTAHHALETHTHTKKKAAMRK